MYGNGICAYCRHKTDVWNQNGDNITREDDKQSAILSHNYFEGSAHGKALTVYWLVECLTKKGDVELALSVLDLEHIRKDLKNLVNKDTIRVFKQIIRGENVQNKSLIRRRKVQNESLIRRRKAIGRRKNEGSDS